MGGLVVVLLIGLVVGFIAGMVYGARLEETGRP